MCVSYLITLKVIPYFYKTRVTQTEIHTRPGELSHFIRGFKILCWISLDHIRNLVSSLFLLMRYEIFLWLDHHHKGWILLPPTLIIVVVIKTLKRIFCVIVTFIPASTYIYILPLFMMTTHLSQEVVKEENKYIF